MSLKGGVFGNQTSNLGGGANWSYYPALSNIDGGGKDITHVHDITSTGTINWTAFDPPLEGGATTLAQAIEAGSDASDLAITNLGGLSVNSDVTVGGTLEAGYVTVEGSAYAGYTPLVLQNNSSDTSVANPTIQSFRLKSKTSVNEKVRFMAMGDETDGSSEEGRLQVMVRNSSDSLVNVIDVRADAIYMNRSVALTGNLEADGDVTCNTLHYTTLDPPISGSGTLAEVLGAGNNASDQDIDGVGDLNPSTITFQKGETYLVTLDSALSSSGDGTGRLFDVTAPSVVLVSDIANDNFSFTLNPSVSCSINMASDAVSHNIAIRQVCRGDLNFNVNLNMTSDSTITLPAISGNSVGSTLTFNFYNCSSTNTLSLLTNTVGANYYIIYGSNIYTNVYPFVIYNNEPSKFGLLQLRAVYNPRTIPAGGATFAWEIINDDFLQSTTNIRESNLSTPSSTTSDISLSYTINGSSRTGMFEGRLIVAGSGKHLVSEVNRGYIFDGSDVAGGASLTSNEVLSVGTPAWGFTSTDIDNRVVFNISNPDGDDIRAKFIYRDYWL